MIKHRFFVLPQQVGDESILIEGADVNHIKNVLRLKVDDELVICDGKSFEYDAKIQELGSSKVKTKILAKRRIKAFLPQVTLVQAISKGTKMDTIVRQATELGVSAVVPVVTSRTIVKLDEEKKKKKRERWQRIAKEAAEQSQRSAIPKVFPVLSWDELLRMVATFDLAIVFWEKAKEMLSEEVFGLGKNGRTSIIIGPEGGFSVDEIRDLEKREVHCLSLGRQILRSETASVVALGIVLYELKKLGDGRV